MQSLILLVFPSALGFLFMGAILTHQTWIGGRKWQ